MRHEYTLPHSADYTPGFTVTSVPSTVAGQKNQILQVLVGNFEVRALKDLHFHVYALHSPKPRLQRVKAGKTLS